MNPRRIILLTAFAALAGPVSADRVVRTDGRIIEGILVTEGGDGATSDVTIRVGGAKIAIPRAQVEKVLPGSPADNRYLLARESLRAGKVGEGLLGIDAALAEGGGAEGAAALLLVEGQRIADAALAGLPPPERAALARILAAVEVDALPRPDDLYARRLQLHFALGETEKAEELLGLLGPLYFKDHPDLAKPLGQWLGGALARQVADGQFSEALETLRRIERIDPEFAKARRMQFFLEWAAHEREAGRWRESLDLYLHHVVDEEPLIGRDRIRVTLAEAEQALRDRNQIPLAAELYEQYGLAQIPEESRERLGQLWRDQGARSLRAGLFEDARGAFRAAARFGAATEVELNRVAYHERLAAIPDSDLLAHYELGVWCVEKKLEEEAVRQFDYASSSPVVGANAMAWIGRMMNARAERELLALVDRYEAGDLVEVLDDLHSYMNRGYGIGYIKQARRLEQMTRDALELRVSDKYQQAEALFDQARRAYYAGRYEEADGLLSTLEEHYIATPAGKRGKAFAAMVRDRLAIAALERGRTPKTEPLAPALVPEDAVTSDSYSPLPGAGVAAADGGTTASLTPELRRMIENLRRIDNDPQR